MSAGPDLGMGRVYHGTGAPTKLGAPINQRKKFWLVFLYDAMIKKDARCHL